MGIFDGVMLVSDYDGTLRGSTLVVIQEDLDAIRRFQEEGGAFVMCTGRCWSAFYQQARDLPLKHPTLLSNGAAMCRMETGEELFCYPLPDRCREDMALVAERFPELALEAYHGEEVYCCHPNRYTEWHAQLVKSSYVEAEFQDMPLPILKVLFEAERDTLAQVQQMVLERWGEHYECIFSSENLLELTAKDVHKGTGVLRAARWLGIDPEHVYCVGDNDNDLLMLRQAAIGFAPAESVMAARNEPGIRVVRDCDHGCVASVIEFLEDRYRKERKA